MNGKDSFAAAIKLFLAVFAAAVAYALFASIYNEIAREDAQLEVVSGAIGVAIAGSLSILLLWIYQRDRQKRNHSGRRGGWG